MLLKVDARVKLLAALSVLAMVLSYSGIAFPAFITLFCVLLSLRMRIPVRVLFIRFAEPLFIAVVVLVLKLFFSGQEVLFSLNVFGTEISGYKDGLLDGLVIGSRITGAVAIVAVLGFSTPFAELMAGLSWFRIPKGFIEVLMFAYRYIFVLTEDALVIYQAQKNRLGYSTIRRGLSSFGTLAGSLTIKAFDHSQSTSVAMVQRGYDGAMPVLAHKSFRPSEIFASALFLLIMGVIWQI